MEAESAVLILLEGRVKKLEVGERIDVRDPNYIWNVGIIKRIKISPDSQRTKFLVIHYEVTELTNIEGVVREIR